MKKMNHKSFLFYSLLFLIALDTISTYYVVFISGIGYEKNPYILFLWNTFGVFLGETIRFSMIGLMFKINNSYVNSKIKKKIKIGFYSFYFQIFLWSLTIGMNLSAIISFIYMA